MLTRINAPGIAPAFSAYAHGVVAQDANRWVHVSGQVGVQPDGTLVADSRGQMVRSFENIFAVLSQADMGPENIVKVTVMLTDKADIGLYREVRDEQLAGIETASTMMIVAGLAHPDWKVEIEVVAAA